MSGGSAQLQPNSAPAASPSDRRSSPRHRIDITLVARPRDNRTTVLRGSVLDLSRGGISVAIAANLDVAEILELQFTLPYAAKPVCTEAVIRRREGYRYSLEFVCMTASEQEKVDRTCAVLALLQ